MRGRALTLVILAISSAALAAPFGVSTNQDQHAPIWINGDADLASCDCIRSGTGAPLDPYVISGWFIQNNLGPAVVIENIDSTHFELRDNSIVGTTAVRLRNTGDRGHVYGNTINHRGYGIDAQFASPEIVGNTLLAANGWSSMGMRLVASNALVLDNVLQGAGGGIHASRSTPWIEGNTVVGATNAMVFTETTTAEVRDNTIHLASNWGIKVTRSSQAVLAGNTVTEGRGGIVVDDASFLTLVGNDISNQKAEAVRFHDSQVTMISNVISHNWAGAVGADDSHVAIHDNVFENSLSHALRLDGVEGVVANNTVRENRMGVALENTNVRLENNVLTDNIEWGLSIPYNSRLAINRMHGNLVNGVNVDGTLVPSERAILYGVSGVTVSGRTFDSGASSGHSGSAIAQGGLVVYDSTNVVVEDNAFLGETTGVTVRASQQVTVRSNLLLNVDVGVDVRDSFSFVKNNTCEIEIDPTATVCIRVRGDFSLVANNTAVRFDVGIDWDDTRGTIENNTVVHSGVGIRAGMSIFQSRHDVVVKDNTLRANVDGMVLVGFRGRVQGNTIVDNADVGITLHARTNATITANLVARNGVGIDDGGSCAGSMNTCSGGVFVRNEVAFNGGTGIRVRGGGTFRANHVHDNTVGVQTHVGAKFDGDVVVHNRLVGVRANGTVGMIDANVSANGHHDGHGIVVRGHCRMWNVTARANAQAGLVVHGTCDGMMGNYSANGEVGIDLHGTLFHFSQVEVSLNGRIGIRLGAEISVEVPRVTVPPITVPSVPNLPNVIHDNQDPLYLSDSNLVGNGEYALHVHPRSIADARANYWGEGGPVYDLPGLTNTPNRVTDNAIVTPFYWKDRGHTTQAVLPQVAGTNVVVQ